MWDIFRKWPTEISRASSPTKLSGVFSCETIEASEAVSRKRPGQPITATLRRFWLRISFIGMQPVIQSALRKRS